MPISYVEDIASAWLAAQGFLVHRNFWLRLGGARRSWTDVDVLAFDKDSVVICSCKAFTGNKPAERIESEIGSWFDEAEKMLCADSRTCYLFGKCVKRLFVVDDPGGGSHKEAKYFASLRRRERPIECFLLKDVFFDLARAVVENWHTLNPERCGEFWKDPAAAIGKEEETAPRLVMQMLRWGILKLNPRQKVPLLKRHSICSEETSGDTQEKARPKCSNCGSGKNLHLVSMPYESGSVRGRLLVYCAKCLDRGYRIGICLPLSMVTPELFLELYTCGVTGSDPSQAVEIVFGSERPILAKEAQALLDRQKNHRSQE